MENIAFEKTDFLYARAFQENPLAMCVTTLDDGRYIEVNKAYSRLLGYERSEIIGLTSNEIGIWVDQSARQKLLTLLQGNNLIEGFEVSLRVKSGESRNFLATVEIIESNGQQCLLIYLQDITSRQVHELPCLESQERFRRISELAQDIIYSISLTPRVMCNYISPSVERILGYPVSEILDEPDWMLSHIHPDDRAELASFLTFPERDSAPPPVELRWYHRDGHIVLIEHRTSLDFGSNGRVIGFVGIGRDISVRKQAEEQVRLNEARLESLMRLSQFTDPDVRHLLDYALQEAIQLTHSKIGSIYHYSEITQELILNTWSQGVTNECHVMSPQTKHYLKTTGLWGESIRQRKPVIINNYSASNPLKKGYPPGHIELSRFISVPVFFNHKIIAVLGLANKETAYDESDVRQLMLLVDSTWRLVESRRVDQERRQAAEKLAESFRNEKRQRQELQEEAQARGLFIDILAHELRTPLTPILASSGMLMDMLREKDGLEKRLIVNLNNSSNNMAERLEELLDLARFARGAFKLNLRPTALPDYLKGVVDRYLPQIEQNKQRLNLEIASGLPFAEIDASRLEQVILNLLSNASKYSPENTEISFRAAVQDSSLRIDVRDQGIGISPADQEKLFQPYHRVEQDRQKYPGIGLGLAVAKQIVETHGGRIWLTSQAGCGSTFSFTIPLHPPDK